MEGELGDEFVVSPAELKVVGCTSFCPGKLLFCQQERMASTATYFEYPSWIVPKEYPSLG